MLMKKKKIVSVALLVAAVIYTIIAFTKMSAGEASNPKGGFLPRIVGLLMVGMCILDFILITRENDPDDQGFNLKELRLFGLIIASFAGYVAALWALGYLIASTLFMYVMMMITQVETVRKKLILSLGITVMFFVIFQVILGVGLPKGRLWEMILGR